jgi:hypothetical protein
LLRRPGRGRDGHQMRICCRRRYQIRLFEEDGYQVVADGRLADERAKDAAGFLETRFNLARIVIIVVAERQNGAGNGEPPTTISSFAVTRYCLALMSPQHSESQIRVGEFPTADRAFELAELIAFDLGIEIESQWSGWTVEVRSAQGKRLFAVPVTGGDCTGVTERPLLYGVG